MPISPIVLQRRQAELGRIRLGRKTGTGRGRPEKLDRFRFTSVSEGYITDLAKLYGGTAQAWDNNGVPSFEVITDATSIPVIVVKGGLSQWMETWSGGGVAHRCDGQQQVDGTPCNPGDPAHQQAKPTTRLSVMLPELEAIGVFRMETHGWNAAAEIPAVAELAQFVGDLVPAKLNLVQRRAVKDGKTSRFVVPVLDLQIGAAKLRELVAAASSGTPLTAVEAPQERTAIASAPAQDDRDPVRLSAIVDRLAELATEADVRAFGNELHARGMLDDTSRRAVQERLHAVQQTPQAPAPQDEPTHAQEAPQGPQEAERDTAAPAGDIDTVWALVVTAGGRLGYDTATLRGEFEQFAAIPLADADAGDLQSFLDELRTRTAA